MDGDGDSVSAASNEESLLILQLNVPELNIQKSLQFNREELVWDVKQQCLAALPKVRPTL